MLKSLCESVPSDGTIAEGPFEYLFVLWPTIGTEKEAS